MKMFLRQRKLNNSFTGGIGSFLLFCMILASVRVYKTELMKRFQGDHLEKATLGDYLLNFLEFYGKYFNPQMDEIIISDGGAI